MSFIRNCASARIVKLAAVFGGGWRLWAASALAASVAVATAVVYRVYFAGGETGSYPYYKLIGNATDAADRLLLMNRIKTSVKSPVDYDNYTGKTTATKTTRNWWEVLDEAEPLLTTANLAAGNQIRLHAKGANGAVLWDIAYCRVGNLNPKTTSGTSSKLESYQNALPWSNTGYSFKGRTSTANQTTAGTLVMQNTPEAQIISSCYADGIGTVYFDAVNGFTGYKNGRLAVEVAYGVFKTNELGAVVSTNIPDDLELEKDADGNDIPGRYVAPDTAHCDEIRIVSTAGGVIEAAETNVYGRCAWVAVNLTGHVFGNDAGPLATNDVLRLQLPLSGNAGSFDNFYRVWAPVQDPSVNPALAAHCRGPMRLRIRRLDNPASSEGTYGMDLDGGNLGTAANNGLLILDNIIVSYPAMQATAEPRGASVAGGSRRNVIGWTGVLSAAYPSVGATGLTAAAGLNLATNMPPDSSVKTDWIDGIRATMNYRWRYLGVTNDWQSLALAVSDGALASTDSLTLPDVPGDIEFYYATELDAPYYGYVDYSGKNVGTPGYSERITRIESRLDPSALPVEGLPSTGTDFFFRLREGKSDQLEFRLQIHRVGGAVTNEIPFHLVSDTTWKAFLRTTTNETSVTAFPAGDYRFRIVGVDPAVTFGGNPVESVPWSGKRLYRSDAANGGWTTISVDAVTGALLFLVMEDVAFPDEMTYTVVHADYQDFNTWSDAASAATPPTYVGAYSETKGRQSGSSPDTREYASELSRWSATATANALYWTEGFAGTKPWAPEKGWGDYAAYESFARCLTPKGWLAQNAQWVCAKWRESAAGGDMALQLSGAGSGSLSFTNTKEMPHGFDAYRLKARVAQGAKFEDFAYYYGEALESMQNYVFTVRAIMGTTAASTAFDGNGSVSLVGYYQPGEGGYELRAERIANNTVRLSLYKWAYDADEDAVLPRLVGRHVTTRNYTDQTYLRCNNAGDTTGLQSQGSYGELFIRCRTMDDGSTVVQAGIMNASKKLSDSTNNTAHDVLTYTDTSDDALTFGTFGFGSLNCPAQFIKPQRYANGAAGTFPTGTTKAKDLEGQDVADMTCASGSVSYPGTADEMFYASLSASKYQNWVFKSNRFRPETVGTQRAAVAVPPTGQLELFVTEDGTERSVGTVAVTGFTYDTNCTFTVRNSADSLIRVATGKRSGDIVVDDVSFTQWCAASYSDSDNVDFLNDIPTQGCPTNFVYLNGWVDVETIDTHDVHTIRLEPARVRAGEVASIRSPLMDGYDGRGIGLGMLSYTYRNADSNCVIRVQYREIAGSSYLRGYTADVDGWTDVATNDFSRMTAEERARGTISTYIGEHGLKGAMRLVLDSQVVRDAQDETKNPGKDPSYGAIEITSFMSRDEPQIDDRCWWGWNLRTTDALAERSLEDSLATDVGLALSLNNSVTEDIEADIADLYPQKLPFVQTPTFATNLVGEVSFRARRLPGAEGATEVAILGAKDGGVLYDDQWTWLDTIVVSNDAYCTYSYKTKDGDDYAAFRLAVIGVSGLAAGVPAYADKMKIDAAARVLIDEVSVSEAVRGKLAFRDVAAFRHDLELNTPIANVTDKSEQPLVREAWGVQGEVYIAQMEDEIDVDKGFEVTLHWFRGEEPWGFANWQTNAQAQAATLAQAQGTSAWIYRSSYDTCPAAVMLPSETNEVVQYTLEVRYWPKNADHPSTNFLSSADWTAPSWYRPVDLNAGRDFSAYTILDTVAPGWAWINEINVFGSYNTLWQNSDANRQYVEIALPREADLTGWSLRFLDGNPQTGTIYTNTVARFGYDLGMGTVPATKTQNAASNCVFLVVACPQALSEKTLDAASGEVDGYWIFENTGSSAFSSAHEIVATAPIGVQLVRPTGIVEHELVMIGTNYWEGTAMDDFDPKTYVDFFNASESGGRYFFAGREHGGDARSLGAFRNAGATSNDWTCAMARTPGRINEGQEIDPNHPTPFGSSVLVYLNIGAHLAQTIEGVTSREGKIAVVPKGDANGLDVTYTADRWYALGAVTTNGTPQTFTTTGARTYRVNVAKNCSNDIVTVEATAMIAPALSEDQGLTADNRYREAVMDWLEGGKDLYENAWADDGSETIHLAEFQSYNGTFVTNLDLTAMYWLDIPPTEAGWVMRGGVSEPPTGEFVDPSDAAKTNVRMSVYLMISNKNEVADWATTQPYRQAHAPYALRGLAPGSSSLTYSPSAETWNSVTFKITGFMVNGKTVFANRENHVPLRWFAFNESSFHPRGHAKEFQATVDVRYPYTKESPAMSYGVRDWLLAHPGEPYPNFYYFWSIDERLQPIAVEVLNPVSTY